MDGEGRADNPPQQLRLPTKADFDAVDIEAPIRGSNVADAHDMFQLYERAFAAARETGDGAAQVVYRLLGHLCGIVLRPSDPGNVWQPLFSLTNDRHSSVAEDYRGEPTELLRTTAAGIENPGLRARFADVAWSNNKRDGASAALAIDAYCDAVDGLLDGPLTTFCGLKPTMAAKTPIHRALQLARFTAKGGRPQERVVATYDRLAAVVRGQGDIGIFVQLAELALEFRLKEASALAPELEAAAQAMPRGSFPMAVKSAWDLAARLYQSLKDQDARQRCLVGAVEQTLAMRDQVSGAGAEATWVMEALQQLRHIQGQEELERTLEADLRRLQKASLKQMGVFEIDLQIGGTPRKVAEHFESLALSDALRTFAMLDASRNHEKLRAEALEVGRTSPLMAMMPITFVDNDGRTVTKSPGAAHEGEPDDVWFTHMIERAEGIHRHRTVAALLEPARLVIQARFGLSIGMQKGPPIGVQRGPLSLRFV